MALLQIKTIRIRIMKALELLYQYQQTDKFSGGYLRRHISKAIKELEELKNRSCSTCEYGRSFHSDEDIKCMYPGADTQGLYFEKDFYCKNWESK